MYRSWKSCASMYNIYKALCAQRRNIPWRDGSHDGSRSRHYRSEGHYRLIHRIRRAIRARGFQKLATYSTVHSDGHSFAMQHLYGMGEYVYEYINVPSRGMQGIKIEAGVPSCRSCGNIADPYASTYIRLWLSSSRHVIFQRCEV
jgi:hypothetical protein